MSKTLCVACRHAIDDAARVCPYCGSDPRSGEKVIDAQAMLHEMFQPRRPSATEGLLQFARQRQGVVIAIGIAVLVLLLAGFHQFIMQRNATAVSNAAAVPLTDVADLSNQAPDTQPQRMPDLKFQIDGNPKTMRSYIVEPNPVAPQQPQPAQQPQQTATQ
ncbi:MAG TPA: zinc ribbon domain-containing protein [Thermoanaerobaculia bacterium]|nr:zinc ribbon domain-containing protein [Thermoanaerobaculia bacterium]